MFLRVPELVAINVNNTPSPFPAEQSFLINTNDVYVGFFYKPYPIKFQDVYNKLIKQVHLLITN